LLPESCSTVAPPFQRTALPANLRPRRALRRSGEGSRAGSLLQHEFRSRVSERAFHTFADQFVQHIQGYCRSPWFRRTCREGLKQEGFFHARFFPGGHGRLLQLLRRLGDEGLAKEFLFLKDEVPEVIQNFLEGIVFSRHSVEGEVPPGLSGVSGGGRSD